MDYLHASNLPLLAGSLLVLIGIASSLLARRFGAPLLLVFLVLGMLLGVDGPGGIRFYDYRATYLVGSLALAIILFDGGLRTRIAETRRALLPASVLARSEEHTSELQSLMRISYAVFCLKKKKQLTPSA